MGLVTQIFITKISFLKQHNFREGRVLWSNRASRIWMHIA